jgi:DNA-binding response OmpR family regulator
MSVRPDERPRVLVVDDEPNLREMLEIGLTQHGFDVQVVADGQAALAAVREWAPDAVILDVMMPKIDGISLLPMLRRITEAPVLMLSAKVEIETRLAGLANGADDYLAKPFELRELALRLRTRLRRPQLARPERLAVDDLEIDLQTRTTMRAGAAIELSAREFDLLAVLMRQPGRVFTRDQLIDLAWGEDVAVAPNAVETYISYVRTKLERPTLTKLIHTIRRVGYTLRAEG